MNVIQPHTQSEAAYWIDKLNLQAHPEGGFYSEIYRSEDKIQPTGLPERFTESRSAATAIYFLLTGDTFSALHKIQSDEGWHFYAGTSGLTIYTISPEGQRQDFLLGKNPDLQESLFHWVPAGHWFGARVNDPLGFALVGCTVAPGFDFQDFQLAKQDELIQQFPQHQRLIHVLTRM
ncbi:cupin domain-containing protein [Pontibacter sp. G13]|uniref:cupin domain-containing protein n=1 Tax=Pontibacter sp. G13 TaxID=3074898 RepID=UPI00288B7D23|nr:cupin domain-containing protein [Pontibacter sp. G13]WNJ16335.1 cupin domain-containing protein [Pontibacter sp. G13]